MAIYLILDETQTDFNKREIPFEPGYKKFADDELGYNLMGGWYPVYDNGDGTCHDDDGNVFTYDEANVRVIPTDWSKFSAITITDEVVEGINFDGNIMSGNVVNYSNGSFCGWLANDVYDTFYGYDKVIYTGASKANVDVFGVAAEIWIATEIAYNPQFAFSKVPLFTYSKDVKKAHYNRQKGYYLTLTYLTNSEEAVDFVAKKADELDSFLEEVKTIEVDGKFITKKDLIPPENYYGACWKYKFEKPGYHVVIINFKNPEIKTKRLFGGNSDEEFYPDVPVISADFGEGLTTVPEAMFRGTGLKSVTFPSTLKTIQDSAFMNVYSLSAVTIPDSVEEIGSYAFYSCSNLSDVSIGTGLTAASRYSFLYAPCTNDFPTYNGIKYIGDKVAYEVISRTETGYTLKEGTTCICEQCFSGCAQLQSITLPESLGIIKMNAFTKCIRLTGITIPNSVKTIESGYAYPTGGTFAGCTALSHVVLPTGLTELGYQLFRYCSSLTSITIPTGVTKVGYYCFEGTALQTLDLSSVQIEWIDSSAFSNISSLTSLTLPNTLKHIGSYAFSYCYGLSSITIPNSVEDIEGGAFARLTHITSLTIPNSVKYLSMSYMCCGCTSLVSVTIPDTVVGSMGYSGITTQKAFYYCRALTSVTLPHAVSGIGEYCFYYCDSLSSITLGENVKSFGQACFMYSTIREFTFLTNEIISFHGNAFGDLAIRAFYGPLVSQDNRCLIYNKTLYAFAQSGATTYSVPEGVTTIGDYCFANKGKALTGITLPNTVTKLGAYSFLQSYFYHVTIPNSVTEMGVDCFGYAYYLSSVTLSDSLTSLPVSGFYGDNRLKTVTIPNSVTGIGTVCFSTCNALTSVTLGSSVSNIGSLAFSACTSLSAITSYATTAPTINNNTFRGVKTGGKLKHPQGSDYSSWMLTSNYYLGLYNWTEEQLT